MISGWRGVGKTGLCLQLVEAARSADLQISGLVSPARFTAGKKTGIEVEDLASRERRLLASLLPGELGGTQLGPWTFDDALFQWGNRALRNAESSDLLVVDELGPLEFEAGTGWNAAFEVLDDRLYQLAIVVIRPEYSGQFRQRYPEVEEFILRDAGEVEALADIIIGRYLKNLSPTAGKRAARG